jgi:hypothetical protein
MSTSRVGAADQAAPAAARALELCDHALSLLYEEKRDGDSTHGFEDLVASVEAVRTELMRLTEEPS